jgi:hypothetical protein
MSDPSSPPDRRAESIRWLLSRLGPPGEDPEGKADLLSHVRRICERDLGGAPPWLEELEAELRERRV